MKPVVGTLMFRLSPHSKSYLVLHSKFILMTQRGIHKNDKFDPFSCPAVQHDPEILTNLTSTAKLGRRTLNTEDRPRLLRKVSKFVEDFFSIFHSFKQKLYLQRRIKKSTKNLNLISRWTLLLPKFFKTPFWKLASARFSPPLVQTLTK